MGSVRPSGATQNDGAILGDGNLAQICVSDSSLRTLHGRVKCPLTSGGRFVGPVWQRPWLDASSQARQRLALLHRFGSLCHVNGDASPAERLPPTSANAVKATPRVPRPSPASGLYKEGARSSSS
jgi:hypothetical protein